VGGPITGKGGRILFIDDPVKNAEEANSEIMRKKSQEWYDSTWQTRAEPGADLRFSGTSDVAEVAMWTGGRAPSVPVTFEGTLAGPFTGPQLALRARAPLAGGSVIASGTALPVSGAASLSATFDEIDLEALLRAFDAVPALIPAGRLTGSATIETGAGAWSLEAHADVARGPRARGRIAIPGSVALRVGDSAWRLEADHAIEGTPVRARLSGALAAGRVQDSTVRGVVSLPETDITRLIESLRNARLADIPAASIDSGRLRAEATFGGTLGRPRMRIVAAADDVEAGGIADLSARLESEGTLRQMTTTLRVAQGADNELVSEGTVFPDDSRLSMTATGRLANLRSLRPDVPFDGVIAVKADLEGVLDALEAAGSVEVPDAAYDRIRLGPLAATFDAGPSRAQATVVARELNARAALTLSERLLGIDLRIDEADVGRLVRDVELAVPVTGRVSLTAQGAVPLDDWRNGSGAIDVSGLDATVGRLPVTASASASFADRLLRIVRLEAGAGRVRLSASGGVPVGDVPVGAAAEGIRARLEGDVADVVSAIRATDLVEVPVVSGRGALALEARVGGTLTTPSLSADLTVSGGELALRELPPVRGIDVRAQLANGWLELLRASGEWQRSRIEAKGRAPLRLFGAYLPDAIARALPPPDGSATLTARASSITPEVLAPWVSPDALAQITGGMDATLRLDAASLDVEALRGELRLDRLDARIAGLPVTQREPTRVVFENGLARVAAWDWAGQGATLGVQGQLRLRDREAAVLAAGRFDVRLLTPFVREAGVSVAGTLAPRVSIFGPLASPTIDGELALEGGEARLRDPRIVATGVNAFAVLTPQRARIANLTGVVNGGTLSGGGDLRYGREAPASARLTAVIAGMGLELPDGLRSELDASLALAVVNAPSGAEGSVTGTVTVTRSAYREPLAVVAGLLNTLRAERVAGARPADSFASRMALDVRVVTEADVVVDNNVARAQIGGDLRVIGTAAAPSLSGRAEIREGGQLFLGRNVYTIDTGTIDFTDPITIRPLLNVEALTRAGGHEIALTLTGPADDPGVDLRSNTEPELGQADVASLLLVGRTLDAVPGDEAEIVGEQVLGYLSGDLLGFASRTIGLDTLRLGGPDIRRDPATVATQTDPTSRLTFGKALGADVDLTYSQSMRNSSAQTWIVDYRPWPRVNLRVVSDDDTLRAYEFRHDLTVGGPPGAARPAAARASDERVVELIVEGVPAAAGDVRRALRLRQGDRFDFAEWQRDRDRIEEALHRAGFLEARVATAREARAEGVALQYDVAEGPRTEIRLSGYPMTVETRRRLELAWVQAIVGEFLEEEAAAIVRDTVAADGYLSARVTADLTAGDPRVLQIAVDPGSRASSRRVEMSSGGDSALARELEAWVSRSGIDVWRAPGELQSRLTAELRDRGHLQARVSVGEPRLDGAVAVLPVTVDAGPRVHIASVRVVGAARVSADRVRDAAALAAGARASVEEIDAARRRVDARYRAEGFTSARVSLDVAASGDAAAITIAVEEGPRQVLRAIAVRGNRDIDEDVVTRAVELMPGEPLAADAWIEARARLFETGLFRRVDVAAEPIPEGTTQDERPMRLVVAIEEWPALRVRYGFQLSERRPEDNVEGREVTPGISADMTRRTLFGRAVTIGAAGEYQPRQRLGRVFLNAPTFFGLPLESLLMAERSRESFADATFVTDRYGVSWEQRMRIGRPLQLSYTYRLDRDHTFDTGPPDPFVGPIDLRANVARLSGAAVVDTRDDPTDATRGTLLSSTFELSTLALGSDFRFIRHVGQAYHFRPWGHVVLASAARLGLARPLGGQELLPSERFFVGGSRSVRGVPEESLGPRLFGDPAGGRALLVLNQEVRVPLFTWVRGVAFLDSGNGFEAPRHLDLRQFVTSYGVGVRITTPFALLRVDYARLWSAAPPEVRPVRWTFGIGQAF